MSNLTTTVLGDCVEVMRRMPSNSVHAVVTDPPYHLTSIVERFGKVDAAPSKVPAGGSGVYARASRGFMGQTWDGGDIAFRVELWSEVLRVLKPGGYLLAFGGSRTYHRMACAIEDSGLELRDCIMWNYGSGFPKSLAVDKNVPEEHTETWRGWGTALKPAFEPIVVARKPLEGTVAANVLKYGTGAMNIDGCRVAATGESRPRSGEASQDRRYDERGATNFAATPGTRGGDAEGRWPANILLSHDVNCSDEDGCVPGCPCALMDEQSGGDGASRFFNNLPIEEDDYPPFFYAAKASRKEREAGCDDIPSRPPPAAELKVSLESPRAGAGRTAANVKNHHPTVKPVSVMKWCLGLVVPPGGVVLDPFMGSGTTGVAAVKLGIDFIGIEQSAEYIEIAKARIAHARDGE